MRISVVVPFSNQFVELDRLVGAIPDSKEIEVVLVDIYSGQDYAPKRKFSFSSVSVHKSNSSSATIGAALNTGISVANGDYLFFVRPGDMVDGSRFLKAMDYLREFGFHGFDDLDILYVYSQLFITNEVSSHLEFRYRKQMDNFLEGKDVDELAAILPPWGKFIKRNLVIDGNLSFREVDDFNDDFLKDKLIPGGASCDVYPHAVYLSEKSDYGLFRFMSTWRRRT